MISGISKSIGTASLAMALCATPVLAKSASHYQDLVGARGSSGEMELERSGFTYIDGHSGSSYVHSFWWHARDKNCIEVKTADGRYQAIVDAPNSDCHQKDGSSGTGAAVAGAALGVALVAALASHKSSHHEDGKHYDDQAHDAQYERGFNDGLHNAAYHNYDKSDYYARGYEAGVDQRSRNTGYHSGKGGYSHHVSLSGIQGRDAIWAIDEMTARGFENVDSFSSGNTLYGIYYNRSAGQCVQMTNADGQVYDIRDIGTHPKCR
ncbi:MAG: hypothetical protein H6915_03325 [Novosphingobium sp.]|nr:hypothetical protein [Novosphingobium sp.]